jgi:hypothetical protein
MLPIKKFVYKVIWEQSGALIIEAWKKEETNKKVYDRVYFIFWRFCRWKMLHL